MSDLCTCPALHSLDHRKVRNHCMRYFLPDGWEYEKKSENGKGSLIVKGRCLHCGGVIRAKMPVPDFFAKGDLYYFLFHQLRTWRPYAMRSGPDGYPAAEKRLAWYQLQDERSEDNWGKQLIKFLPEEYHEIVMWFSGFQTRHSLFDISVWPAGSVIRFKYEYRTTATPQADYGKELEVCVQPFQEMRVTDVCFHLGQPLYCGLLKTHNQHLYRLDKVPGYTIYSMNEWSALQQEHLSQPGPLAETRNFENPYPPESVKQLFVLNREADTRENIDSCCIAVSPYPDLLKGMLHQDVQKLDEQGKLPADAASGSVEGTEDGGKHYVYRWSMCNEDGEYLRYIIKDVPMVSALISLPKGGED